MVAQAAFILLTSVVLSSGLPLDDLALDAFAFWDGGFRDNTTGLYCDHTNFGTIEEGSAACHPGMDQYWFSSAGTGMGLIADAAATELGLHTKAVGAKRAMQTLTTVATKWPKEPTHNFYAHFVAPPSSGPSHPWTPTEKEQYSTVDTGELMAGAIFAGNYYGGDVQAAAEKLACSPNWEAALGGADHPTTIFPVVDFKTGQLSGNIRPFNEYYIVAYLAARCNPGSQSKSVRFFETFFSSTGKPRGGRCDVGAEPCPAGGKVPTYLYYNSTSSDVGDGAGAGAGAGAGVGAGANKYLTMSDNDHKFMSSFIPQFCFYMCKGFQANPYYSTEVLPGWAAADRAWWADTLKAFKVENGGKEPVLDGHVVTNRIHGSGAGASPEGYGVDRINVASDRVFSAAIMAGWIGPATTKAEEATLVAELQWLRTNKVCSYNKQLVSTGATVSVLWRCSVNQPSWRAPSADSIDFATYVLGYASHFLPTGFYARYAA